MSSALLSMSEANEQLLASLPEPKSVWRWFLLLSQQPRVPEHCGQVKQWLMDVGEHLGCEVRSDEAGNVVLSKPATKGYEDVPSVCLQGHMDMVCSSNDGVVHDFHKDQLKLYIDGEWLKAKDTTLGADDGIGVALCLALLSDEKVEHGPIEALFTADEETTMGGAENIDRNILKSNFLINLDSEDGNVCIGCAGGFEVDFDVPVTREEAKADTESFELFFSGLRGGHSGVDIHRGRGNAFKFIARILQKARLTLPSLRLSAFYGGTAINTIPREGKAVVSVAKGESQQFLTILASELEVIKQEFNPVEDPTAISCTATSISSTQSPLTSESTQKVLDVVTILPFGPLRMVPHDLTQVETSINLGKIELTDDNFNLHPFARSSSVTQTEVVFQQLSSYARLVGAKISDKLNAFPGWDPARQMTGKLLKPAVDIMTQVNGHAPNIYSIHAGLECGLFIGAYPNMECISIGPIIEEAHTPQERCNIPSVEKIYDIVQGLIKTIPKN